MSSDINELLRRLAPILGEREVNRAWQQLQLADPKTAKLIEFSLRRRLAEATGSTFRDRELLLEPIPEEKAKGEMTLGTVAYGSRPLHLFGLERGELLQHLAIVGRSGGGKTNLAFLLLHELSRLRIPFLVLDWKKNYRDLLALPAFNDLVVYTVGRDQVTNDCA